MIVYKIFKLKIQILELSQYDDALEMLTHESMKNIMAYWFLKLDINLKYLRVNNNVNIETVYLS